MSIILLLFILEVSFIIHEVAMFVQNGSPRLRQLWRYGGRARGAAQDQQSVAQPVHLRQHQEKLGTDLRGTLQRGSSGGSHAPDLGPFEVVQGATLLHVMRNVNEQPAVRSVGGSAILSGA